MRSISYFVALLALVLAGCTTQFTGDPHVEGGPAGCERKCAAWGEEFVGMVAMGEYSDACICHVPGKPLTTTDAAAPAGGAAGAVKQTDERQQQTVNGSPR